MPSAKARLLALILRSERELDTLFTGLAEQIATEVTRASLFQPVGPSLPSLDGSPPVALEQAGAILQRCRTLITRTFIGTASDGTPAPYEIMQGAVVPLAPYMRILWPLLLASGTQAIERHTDLLRKRLKNYPDVWAAYEPIWTRKVMGIVHEQDGGVEKPLAAYNAPHLWVSPDGYRLSDRIWRSEEETRRKLDLYLKDAINSGKGSATMTKELVQFLKPGLELPVTNRPYGTKVSYNAMRLARTEIAAAYNRADFEAMQHNPAVEEYDVLLSNSHVVIDICDEIAAMGPYEKGDTSGIPPFHPQCLCTMAARSTQDVRKLIEQLRAEIAEEFPDMVIPKPGGDFSLQLEGVKLPTVGTESLVPKLDGTIGKTATTSLPPAPAPPVVPPPAKPTVTYGTGSLYDEEELAKWLSDIDNWPSETDWQIYNKTQARRVFSNIKLMAPEKLDTTLAFDQDGKLFGAYASTFSNGRVSISAMGVRDATLGMERMFINDAAYFAKTQGASLMVDTSKWDVDFYKSLGFWQSSAESTVFGIPAHLLDDFLKTGHAGGKYGAQAAAAGTIMPKAAIPKPPSVTPEPPPKPTYQGYAPGRAPDDLDELIEKMMERKQFDSAYFTEEPAFQKLIREGKGKEAFDRALAAAKGPGEVQSVQIFNSNLYATLGPKLDKDTVIEYMRDAANLHKQPVILGKSGGKLYILDGHHRLEALYRVGAKNFSAYIVDIDRLDDYMDLSSPAWTRLQPRIEAGQAAAARAIDAPIDEVFDEFGSMGQGRIELKKRIMENLGNKLRDDDEFMALTDAIVRKSTRTGEYFFEFSEKGDLAEEIAAQLVKKWAHTSGDNDELSVAIQLAAKKEFNLKGGISYSATVQKKAMQAYGDQMNGLRKFVRAQYEETQAYFNQLGVKEMWLFRGMENVPASALGATGLRDVETFQQLRMTHNPLSSYSSRWNIATRFSGVNTPGREEIDIMIGGFVDTKDVLSIPLFGNGCADEYEAVLIGRARAQWVFVPQGYTSFQFIDAEQDFFKQLQMFLATQ